MCKLWNICFCFFSLGLFGEKYRMLLWINFFLDIAICIISLILNISKRIHSSIGYLIPQQKEDEELKKTA